MRYHRGPAVDGLARLVAHSEGWLLLGSRHSGAAARVKEAWVLHVHQTQQAQAAWCQSEAPAWQEAAHGPARAAAGGQTRTPPRHARQTQQAHAAWCPSEAPA
jgi:hypothetical protein